MSRFREGRLRFFNHDPSGPHSVRPIIDHVVVTSATVVDHIVIGGAVPLTGFVGFQSQLTATVYAANGQIIPGVTASWSSDNPLIASVDSNGLVTFNAAGSANISALVDARSYATTAAVSIVDEVTYLRTNLVGGDAAMLGLYSATYNAAASGGFVTAWSDARGGGFGPDLTPTDAAGPALVGSVATTRVLRGSASHALKSALTSLFDLGSAKTLIYVGGMAGATNNGSPLAIGNSGLTSYLTFNPTIGQVQGFDTSGSLVGTSTTRRAQSARKRLYAIGSSGTSAVVSSPLYADISLTISAHPSATHQIFVLQNGAGTYSQDDCRAVMVLNRVLTTADKVVLEAWAQTYHSSVTNGSRFVAWEGDSITEGAGVVSIDARTTFATSVMEDAFFVGFDDINDGVSGSRWSDLTSRVATIDAALAGRTKKVLVLLCGLNNLFVNGDSAATVEAAAWAYCDARKAANPGLKIAIGCVIPCNQSGANAAYPTQGSLDTAIADLNARYRANFATHADAVIDYTLDVPFNAAGGWSNATYYQGDGVHPNATGHAVMKARALPVVTALAT